ncbi:hypothetical protein [Ensifer sp. 1H6]|uniref:hypothetical protein n=1 Tax=Ensifer sp. 1H6 TaxID=1911585 RepID=UPI0009C84B69|nr:hypothetical protein [Ensifer sp. 1H6]OMQ44919.1 hypothetical protein BKP54_11030 [Ensifer sp. 1H6]
MSLFTKTANDTFAPHDVAGNARQVENHDAQVWGTEVERLILAFQAGGGIIFPDKATMDATLTYAANQQAWVMGDATVGNNGVYRKVGASGTGSWQRLGDLPYSFIPATDVGAGTPNAIQATTGVPVNASALIRMNVIEANTASPVTVSFNGGAALTVKTNSGNDVAAGGLVAGMIVLGSISGSTFRLISDQVSSAVVAAAEAAQAAAELAKNQAITAASSVQSEQPSRAWAAANYHPAVAPDFIRTAGFAAAADGGGALYAKVASEPSIPSSCKFSITLSGGATIWYKLAELEVYVEMCGAKGDSPGNGTGTDDRQAFQDALDFSLRVYMGAAKTYRIHGLLEVRRFQQLIGLGGRSATDYWVDIGQTGATRLHFTGSGQACFVNKNTALMLSHGQMKGFVFRADGSYSYMIYFRQMLDFRLEDLGMQTDSLTMHGIRSQKITSTDPSWVNSMKNVFVRLPDASDGRPINVDWSDSTVDTCHFTGGIGSNDGGFGVRWINSQFERSKYVGLTVTKTGNIGAKNSVIEANSFDANKTHGILLDATGDTSGAYKFATIITGNNFRTEDPNTGVAGSASIAFINPSANNYKVGPLANNVELSSGVTGYAQSGPWTIPASGVMNIHS